ncbi:MAG: peptide-methionine (S)-S-oxide reductase MsrA [Bacteroidia bacterium]|jgi:peptide-methionine (S)-S-oxide reductase|nr:peptide-methionine (S)-S-oxide reductase MsrA [Bacteroidota bacterium]MBP6511595.1 peptide-methionine (S)-S-oxide reductase MsrA [Bacteroidia bacterium]MBP7244083.1 peptide-methionine (S)-S-oxide reductase MsrA [Bacteroidia bacterium]
MKTMASIFLTLSSILLMSCGNPQASSNTSSGMNTMETTMEKNTNGELDTAIFGAGCFWCVEAIFQQLEGVEKVASGYSGGARENPTYDQVCSGATGHAEVIQVIYDPAKISFVDLLEVFWGVHDPTTLNRQGADVGTQYRSVIFYTNADQKKLAEDYKKKLNASGAFPQPVVTEISPLKSFFVAENYHQNYFNENGNQPYCSLVIRPKLDKFKKVFGDKMK